MAGNNYVLGKRIARGGMAEIYLGKAVGEAAFQRICAIKRILPHYSQDREFIEMFRDEAHICKRLQHANIVQVYDFTEVEGSYALIMEHVDGGDLRTLLSACEIARSRVPVPMSLYIAANAARALHYAHTKSDEITNEPLGIVHRDISPQNILISFEGEVKITDFGIASAENKITETRPGVVKGKYSYMSPEQVAAKPLDGRSDVFSLAIVLWESLAMKRLFAGQTEVESIRKVQNCEINYDLRQLNSLVDDDLYRIVMKGLAKERKNRYQTAAAFEKDLLKYLHSKYSDFTAGELGNFLKRILAKKRDKTQDDIKETLSQLASDKAPSNVQGNIGSIAANGSMVHAQNDLPETDEPLQLEKKAEIAINLELDENAVSGEKQFKIEPDPSYSFQSAQKTNSFQASQHSQLSVSARSRPLPRGTNANRAMYQQQPQRRQQSQLKRGGLRRVPFVFLGAVAVLAGILFGIEYLNDEHLHLRIESVPNNVQISVNGIPIKQDGAYTETPAKISLKPGKYSVEIARPGYKSEKITVSGQQRETKKLPKFYLKRLPDKSLVPVRILSPDKKLYINVDNGLFRGSTPMSIELTPGEKHSIFFLTGEGQKKRPLRCKFTTQESGQFNKPQVLTIRILRKGKVKCSIRN